MLCFSGRSKAASQADASQAALQANVGVTGPNRIMRRTLVVLRPRVARERNGAAAVKAQGEHNEQNSPGDFAHDASMAGADSSRKVRSGTCLTDVDLSSSCGGSAAWSVCCAVYDAYLQHS